MTRKLVAVSAREPLELLHAVRAALDRSGPAVVPIRSDIDEIPEIDTLVPQPTAVVIETSGSTGIPKRVAIGCDALLASAAASATVLGGTGQWLLALPTHYVAGLQVLVRSIAAETTPVVLEPGHFRTEAFIAASRTLTGDLRFTSLVPAQLIQLLESRAGVSALRRFDGILVGGQAVPFAVRDRIDVLGLPVFRTYGSSETSGGCVYNGSPLPGVQARITDDGQVELAGPMLAEGYLDANGHIDAQLTAAAFDDDNGQLWYRTGDLGEIDEAGVLHVTGRADNVIISGGVNVNLDRVERVVRGIRGFADAVVVGAPDERWGEVPAVVTTSAEVSLDEIGDAVAAKLGIPARPARIVRVASIPALASGKPDRLALTQLAAE